MLSARRPGRGDRPKSLPRPLGARGRMGSNAMPQRSEILTLALSLLLIIYKAGVFGSGAFAPASDSA